MKVKGSPFDHGHGLTAFVVFVAIAMTLIERRSSLTAALLAMAAGALYVAVTILAGNRIDRDSPTLHKTGYFLLAFAVLGGLMAIFVRERLFGVMWLVYMPMVAQGRIFFRLPGTITVAVAALAMMALHIRLLEASFTGALPDLLALATAVVFVLVFSDIAMRESTARADLQRLSTELEDANQRLGAYAIEAAELAASRERTRMAREIHDSVGHSLTAVHMQIEAARAVLDHDPDTTRAALDKAQQSIHEGLAEIRRSVSTLRADPLDGQSLESALDELVERTKSGGLAASLETRGEPIPLSPARKLAAFRVAQEGITNSRKHAAASQIEIVLDYATSDTVRLEIRDDGVGSETPEGGFGLLGLRERARQVDGRLDVVTAPGEGFTLVLELPAALELPA